MDPDPALRNRPILGANDGASGVAVLLEIARVFANSPLPVDLDLVFFDLEDMGNINNLPYSIGAKQFVTKNPFYRPSAGIIVDMVCAKNLSIPRELYSQAKAGQLMDKVWQIAKQQKSGAFKHHMGISIIDDHLPFLNAGISVVDLIHYPFPDHWHTTADTVDKCSSHSLQQVGDVLQQFIAAYKPWEVFKMNRLTITVALTAVLFSQLSHGNDLAQSIEADYRDRLGAMFRDCLLYTSDAADE